VIILSEISIALSQKAKNHIKQISEQLPVYQNWIKEQIENCTLEYNVVSKVIDFDEYLLCIVAAIENFIEKSNFDYNYTVKIFADQAVLKLIQNPEKLTYDKICMLAIMGYVNLPKVGDILNQLLKQFETKPYKFNKSNLVNYLYLWKKGDIDDFTLIYKIFTYWINFLVKAKINSFDSDYDGNCEIEEAIRNEVEIVISNKLK